MKRNPKDTAPAVGEIAYNGRTFRVPHASEELMDASQMRPRTHRGVEYLLSPAHPAAEAFPWLDEDKLQALADDIDANGQKVEVVRLPDGRVIDGRNRELACRVAGVEPRYRTADLDEAGIVALVLSANIHRRSLTPSQRAMIAAELANMRQGERTDLQPSAPVPEVAKVSQEDAAKKLKVAPRSVRSAKKVKDEAPELVEPVKAGKLDVKTAEKATKLPPGKRKKIANAKDPKKAAKEALDKAAAKTSVQAVVEMGKPGTVPVSCTIETANGFAPAGDSPDADPQPEAPRELSEGEEPAQSGTADAVAALTDRERKQRVKALELAVTATNALQAIHWEAGRIEAFHQVYRTIVSWVPEVLEEATPTAAPTTGSLTAALHDIDRARGELNHVKNVSPVASREVRDVLDVVKRLRAVADRLMVDMREASSTPGEAA